MRGPKNLCGNIGVMVILLVTLFTGASALAHEIWVTNQGTDKVQVINSATLKEIASFSTDSKPHNIEFSPDFTRAYVSNVGAGTVTVIDAVGRKIVATVPTGKGAHGVNGRSDATFWRRARPFANRCEDREGDRQGEARQRSARGGRETVSIRQVYSPIVK
jgi:YVTN family beta-propeller protein